MKDVKHISGNDLLEILAAVAMSTPDKVKMTIEMPTDLDADVAQIEYDSDLGKGKKAKKPTKKAVSRTQKTPKAPKPEDDCPPFERTPTAPGLLSKSAQSV